MAPTLVIRQDTSAPTATSNHDTNSGLTDTQIGIIVGTILSLFIVLTIIICCCCGKRRPAAITVTRFDKPRSRSSYASSDGWSEPLPPRVVYVDPQAKRKPRRQRPVVVNGPREYVRPIPRPNSTRASGVPIADVRPAPAVWMPRDGERELIPGAPKYPTYRALPIPNPRKPRVAHMV